MQVSSWAFFIFLLVLNLIRYEIAKAVWPEDEKCSGGSGYGYGYNSTDDDHSYSLDESGHQRALGGGGGEDEVDNSVSLTTVASFAR